jgi:hypothetical protein
VGESEKVMNVFDSGSMIENNKRLEILYKESHQKLLGTAFNSCKHQEIAEDLVGELYCYLGEKARPNLYWKNSFNIFYCVKFIQSRWINKVKRDDKVKYNNSDINAYGNEADTEYDIDWDEKIAGAYSEVLNQISQMEKTPQWASAKLYKMYWIDNPEETLEGISKKIKISNSTAFKHIKLAKQHLKNNIKNPFND